MTSDDDVAEKLWRPLPVMLGPLLALVIWLLPAPDGLPAAAWAVIAVTAWMIVWWISEAVPIPVTSLVPIPFYPALGIADVKATTSSYAHPMIFLFLGGFILAAAMQRSGLHRRIALAIISFVGNEPTRMIAGFMLATAFLSMWISNTATTLMMFSVALSVVHLKQEQIADPTLRRNFSVALLLSIAYSASIGGVGTPIGTPPNALLASILESSYGIDIDFVTWMSFALPVIFLMLPAAWLVLTKVAFPIRTEPNETTASDAALTATGPMRAEEKLVLAVFCFAAFGWIFGKPLASVAGVPVSDTAVAIVAALMLFSIPYDFKSRRFVLAWEHTRDIPWGVLLMLGGGLAIAAAFSSSGLAAAIGASMKGFSEAGVWIFVLLATAMIVVITEITSNTASAATFLPILGAIAVGLGLDPRLLMVPVTLGASMAFMMPVATAPNAIVFAHKDVHIIDMVRAGVWLNLISVGVCFAAGYFWVSTIFGIELN